MLETKLTYDAHWTEADYTYAQHAFDTLRDEWESYVLLRHRLESTNEVEVRIVDGAQTRAFSAIDEVMRLMLRVATDRGTDKNRTF